MYSEEEKFEQAKRVLYLLNEFLAGKRYNTKEIQALYEDRYRSHSIKTVQRDLRLLQDEIKILENERDGRQWYWSIPKSLLKGYPTNFHADELISLYLLKAFLRTFSGSSFEEDINNLIEKISKKLPGEVFISESLIWEQSLGKYDYSGHKIKLKEIINHIINKTWIEIRYLRVSDLEENQLNIFPVSIYEYAGNLYLIGYYAKYKTYLSFVLQNILEIQTSKKQSHNIPNFNYSEFKKTIFAAYSGEQEKVVLKVSSSYVKYFEKRFWHPSQEIEIDEHGNMILTMKVPIASDLISWILSWHEAITVLEPKVLKNKIIEHLELAQRNYF